MSNTRTPFVPEDTIKDGNCSVNSFALGLANPDLLKKLDQYLAFKQLDPQKCFAFFISQVAGVLGVEPRWTDVRNALIRVRETDKIRLQETLAPLLRNIAVAEMKKDGACINRTIQPLCSAFRDVLCQKAGIFFKGSPDDVYSKLSLIKSQVKRYANSFIGQLDEKQFPINQYNYLRQAKHLSDVERATLNALENRLDNVLSIYQEQLLAWWQTKVSDEKTGYEQFLEVLRQKGEWLGDLELSYLAAYFHLDLDAYREPFFHQVHINKLSMPSNLLTQAQIQQLRARGIIENPESPDSDIFFLPFLSAEALCSRLASLPNRDALMTFFNAQPALKKKPLPDEFSPQLEQLRLRNIVELSSSQYVFVVDQADAIDRSIEVTGALDILNWWLAHYFPAAKMTLKNAVGVHWENMLAVSMPAEPEHASALALKSVSAMQLIPNRKYQLGLFYPDRRDKNPLGLDHLMPMYSFTQSPVFAVAFLAWLMALVTVAQRQYLANQARLPLLQPKLFDEQSILFRMPAEGYRNNGLFHWNQDVRLHPWPTRQQRVATTSSQDTSRPMKTNPFPCTIL